jgi:hypothetical protein
MSRQSPCWQPNPIEELLLKAVVRKGDESLQAYLAWKKVIDLDRLEGPSFLLLPMLFRKLEEHQWTDDLLPRLGSIYKQAYFKNQLILREMQNSGITSIDRRIVESFYPDRGTRPLPSLIEQQNICRLIPSAACDEEFFLASLLAGISGQRNPTLVWVMDAAQILKKSAQDFSWPELIAIAKQQDWGFHLAEGLNYLGSLGLTIPQEVLDELTQITVSRQEFKILTLGGSARPLDRLHYLWLVCKRKNHDQSLLTQSADFLKTLQGRYGVDSWGGLMAAAYQRRRRS